MYIFGEDVAQTDPDTAHVVARAGEPRVPRLPGDLRERDDEVRRRRPARLRLPREGRDLHQRRAAPPARRAGDRPARGGAKTDFEIITTVSRGARPRDGLGDARGTRCDEIARADARTSPGVSRERLGRARPAVAGRAPTAPTRRPSTTSDFDRPGGRGHFAALPYKAPGDAADEEFPLILVTGRRPAALQRRHDDPPHRQRSTWSTATCSRSTPTTPRGSGSSDGDTRLGAQPRRPDRGRRRGSPSGSSPGHVFTTFHFPETRTNLLVGQSADVNTSCPEYKVIAVDVRPMPEVPSERAALTTAS